MSASSKTKLPELPPVMPPPLPIPGPTDHEVSQFIPSGAKFLKVTRKPSAAPPQPPQPPTVILNADLARLRNIHYLDGVDPEVIDEEENYQQENEAINTVIELEEDEPVPESDSNGGFEPDSIAEICEPPNDDLDCADSNSRQPLSNGFADYEE